MELSITASSDGRNQSHFSPVAQPRARPGPSRTQAFAQSLPRAGARVRRAGVPGEWFLIFFPLPDIEGPLALEEE